MEWQSTYSEGHRSGDRLRCIPEGMGACCSKQRTGGPWSQQECSMHINCLELLAATLAVKTFAKAKITMSILLRIDNTTAVAYINNLGGTASKELVILTRDLWMWCLERNIHIAAVHLPGVLNTVADTESRQMLDRTDWKLNPVIFQKINNLYGPLDMDLFASQLSTQCPHYFSWRPDPYALATDAFSPGLDSHEVVRESSVESGGPGSSTSAVTTSSSGASSSCLKDTTLVPNVSEHADRPSPVDNTESEDTCEHRSNASTSSASRMAHLRDEFRSQNFSEEATALILKSWRTKTNKSYDSLFAKLHSWCAQRSFDPFSGPTINVANFLAQLCTEGYQYSSINFYRSAISSVHEKVDGHNVGQHPLISRLLKGIFHDRPLLPRYTNTWNVQTVLNYLEGLGESIPVLKGLNMEIDHAACSDTHLTISRLIPI